MIKNTVALAVTSAVAGIIAGAITTGSASSATTWQPATIERTVQLQPCEHRRDLNCYWDGSRLLRDESFSVFVTYGGQICREYVDPYRQWALEETGSACTSANLYAPPVLRRDYRPFRPAGPLAPR